MPAPKLEFLLSAFFFLAISRTIYAIFIPIADCDETYNYWEPAHFLTYGSGKQTWEYAPEFALRSWMLVWIYTWPGFLLTRFVAMLSLPAPSKVFIYYSSRVIAGLISSMFETYFIGGIVIRFGQKIARISLLLLCSCAGFANSSTSFLPSTFAMYAAFVAGGAILRLESARLDEVEISAALKIRDASREEEEQEEISNSNRNNQKEGNNNKETGMGQRSNSVTTTALTNVLKSCQVAVQRNSVRCIWSAVIGTVIGWPFAALSMVPFALLVLVVCRPFFIFPAREAAAALIAASIGVSILDSVYYCKRESGIFSTWNLVKYNVFSGGEGKGPELYGVEPWHFFFKNLFLNFNFVFPLSLLSIAYSILELIILTLGLDFRRKSSAASKHYTRGRHVSNLILASPFVLWFLFWMRIPHKEERFMVPVYPFIIMTASFFLGSIWTQSEATSPSSSSNNNIENDQTTTTTTTTATKNDTTGTTTTSTTTTSPKVNKNNNNNKLPLAKRLLKLGCSSLLTLIIVLNVSRTVALWRYYGESDRAASWLYTHIQNERSLGYLGNRTICVGKDWHRMPPSYFAPVNTRIRFVESSAFVGALPQEFVEDDENPTCTTRTPMNDLNQPAKGQSIALKNVAKECDYIFDTTLGDGGKELTEALIGGSMRNKDFASKLKILKNGEILDASQSPWYSRVLYFPMWSEKFAKWAQVLVATLKK